MDKNGQIESLKLLKEEVKSWKKEETRSKNGFKPKEPTKEDKKDQLLEILEKMK